MPRSTSDSLLEKDLPPDHREACTADPEVVTLAADVGVRASSRTTTFHAVTDVYDSVPLKVCRVFVQGRMAPFEFVCVDVS